MFFGACVAFVWICANLTDDRNPQELIFADGICMFCFFIGFCCMFAVMFNKPDMLKSCVCTFFCLAGLLAAKARNSNVGVAGSALLIVLGFVSMFQC